MKYRKKPVVIDAWQWNETNTMRFFLQSRGMHSVGYDGHTDRPDECKNLQIATLEGHHVVSPGDYIIRGIKGEWYPCKPDIFEATYDPV